MAQGGKRINKYLGNFPIKTIRDDILINKFLCKSRHKETNPLYSGFNLVSAQYAAIVKQRDDTER